jgi:multidrug resistance efflux pump
MTSPVPEFRRVGRRPLHGPLAAAGASTFVLALAAWGAVADEPAASRGEAATAFHARGLIQPLAEITLRSPVDAAVVAVRADVGQTVERGQVLVEFDAAGLERTRDTARAGQQQTGAQAEVSRSAVDQAREAEERLRKDAGLAEEIAAEPGLSQARGRGRRDGEARSAIMRAPLRERARERASTVAGRVEAGLVRVQMQRSLAERMRGQIEEADALARTARRSAETVLERYAQVAAPAGGVVASRSVDPGERVTMGGELLSIIQTDRVRVLLWIPPERLPWPGQSLRAEIRPDAEPGRYEGVVSAIGPQPHPRTGRYVAEVELDNADGRLRPGTFVGAKLTPADAP